MPEKIVIGAALPGEPDKRLDGFHVVRPENGRIMDNEELGRHLPGATALVTILSHRISAEVLDRAPQLRLVSNVAVGFDNVDVAAATERGVLVTNTPDVLTEATADLAFALLLAVAREVVTGDRYLREGRYTGWLPGELISADVSGQNLGIVGLGRIGQAVARRAVGFGMNLCYTDRVRVDGRDEATLGVDYVSLEALLRKSDIVSLHCPLNQDTHHLINAERLRLMPSHAILINTARGPVVDEQALATALRDGVIAGAGLDVYEHEPAVEPALLELDNVVLLPHVGSGTRRTRQAMASLAVEAVDDLLAGRRPKHPVNPEVLEGP